MNIEKPVWIALDQNGGHDPHPARHHHHLDGLFLKTAHKGMVQFFAIAKHAMVQQGPWDAETFGALLGFIGFSDFGFILIDTVQVEFTNATPDDDF